jgi:general secretion pathway protein E/type IV pilus assembly protein PilB
VNIMTLEDPVEYPMAMIRQTSVNEVVKLDFASGIRSMMRQDPDIILVGEIRDQETAEMAFRAAMTGHQVYSTLHTNSSIGAIPRLMDLGVLPDIMAGNIIGVIAQRLMRKLCIHCRVCTPDRPRAACSPWTRRRPPVYPVGCAKVRNQVTGAPRDHGDLQLVPEIDELIARRATGREIRTAAAAKGFRTLADDAVSRVLLGQSSLEEISRVVDLTDRVI